MPDIVRRGLRLSARGESWSAHGSAKRAARGKVPADHPRLRCGGTKASRGSLAFAAAWNTKQSALRSPARLLLRQSPESGARVRAVSGGPAGAGTGWRHGGHLVSQRSRSLRPWPRTTSGASSHGRFTKPPLRYKMLSFGDVSRFHQGTMVFDVPAPVPDRGAGNRDAGDDERSARRRRSSRRRAELSRLFRKIHDETVAGQDCDGFRSPDFDGGGRSG